MKSGLPSAAARIRRADVVGELRSARESRDQQLAVLAGERLEQDRRRVELAAAPAGSKLEQLGAGDAEEEDRRVAGPVGDVLDQVEEDGLGPLDVVEDEDLRPRRRPRLDQLAKGELRVRGRAADHLAGLDADREQDLDERPVGDVLAVVEAAAAQHVGGLAGDGEELLGQPRLADPGRPEQREHVAHALRDDVLEGRQEPLLLAHTADERRIEVAREGIGRRIDGDEAERGHRLALPLQLERFDGLDGDGISHERERLALRSGSRPSARPARVGRRR